MSTHQKVSQIKIVTVTDNYYLDENGLRYKPNPNRLNIKISRKLRKNQIYKKNILCILCLISRLRGRLHG